MSNQKQAIAGPVVNEDYQLLLDRLLELMRKHMGERLLAVCLYGSLAPPRVLLRDRYRAGGSPPCSRRCG